MERKFGLNARAKAAGMLREDGVDTPLTARVIKAIDDEINPYTRSKRADRFVASQRAVFERAIEDAVVSVAALRPGEPINVDPVHPRLQGLAVPARASMGSAVRRRKIFVTGPTAFVYNGAP